MRARAQMLTEDKLHQMIAELHSKPEFKHAHIGICIRPLKGNGKSIAYNENDLFVPASALKVLTLAYSLDQLGDTFYFKTKFYYKVEQGKLYLFVLGDFDPTLGSLRFPSTRPEMVLSKLWAALSNRIKFDSIVLPIQNINTQEMPAGGFNRKWYWEDLANYYASPIHSFNWRENYYTLTFNQTLQTGDTPKIIDHTNADSLTIVNRVTTTDVHASDQAYLFFDPVHSNKRWVVGTLPNKEISIKGTDLNPVFTFSIDLENFLKMHSVKTVWEKNSNFNHGDVNFLVTITSPTIKDVIRQMMKYSINLYCEGMAAKAYYSNRTSSIKKSQIDYMESITKDSSPFKIYDACGLSAANRITPKAFCEILNSTEIKSLCRFHNYLNRRQNELNKLTPELFIKEGSMEGVYSLVGYYVNPNGVEYSFAVFANDIQGNQSIVKIKIIDIVNLTFGI